MRAAPQLFAFKQFCKKKIRTKIQSRKIEIPAYTRARIGVDSDLIIIIDHDHETVCISVYSNPDGAIPPDHGICPLVWVQQWSTLSVC